TMSRENPPAADRVELGRVEARANVTNLSAEAGEVFRPGKPLTAGRPDSIRVVIDRREADDRGQALAEFVAEVAAGLQWVAGCWKRTRRIRVGEEGERIERDAVSLQRVAAAEAPIFRDREAHPQRPASRRLREGRVARAADEVEVAIVATEQVAADHNRLVEEIWVCEPQFDRFRIDGPIDGGVERLAL